MPDEIPDTESVVQAMALSCYTDDQLFEELARRRNAAVLIAGFPLVWWRTGDKSACRFLAKQFRKEAKSRQ